MSTTKCKTKFLQAEGESKEQIDEKVNAYIDEHGGIRVRDIAYQVAVTQDKVFHYAFITYEEAAVAAHRVGF
ncbi:hypothetical protein CN918_26125 [Priestia megaterium]|nr:hypothetical protein CN918_26125 [Priestia megaterium]